MGQRKSSVSPVIRASEIGQYVFCSMAWQLSREGYVPDSPALERGAAAHRSLGVQLEGFDKVYRIVRWIGGIAAVLMALEMLGLLVGVLL
ncbi:MAG: hypothetical protein KKC68_07135 [Candidatus Thermoplasmatota archaeon]|nr:hypothetical protein [Candidatus Thermoplasmatota archaeon]MBU1941534.1 hypothetical protein [Candidatus Thermoplasmatota archaeon]